MSASIVLYFTGLTPNVSSIQLPIQQIYSDTTLVFDDGTLFQTLTQATQYPNNPVYVPLQPNVTITVTGGFSWFGAGNSGWAGNKYLSEVQSWSSIPSLNGAFFHCTRLTLVPNYLPANIQNISFMFNMNQATEPSIFTGLDANGVSLLDTWNTSTVINMESMFTGCTNLSPLIDWSNFDTGNVTNMSTMFALCTQFAGNGIDVWKTSLVTSMQNMFGECINISSSIDFTAGKNGDPHIWNMANVQNASGMFNNATHFTGIGVNTWDTSSIISMRNMFTSTQFNADLGSWNIQQITDMTGMLTNTAMSPTNYTSTLIGWSSQPNSPNNITLGAYGCQYLNDAITPRNILVQINRWTITDNYFISAPQIVLQFSNLVPGITAIQLPILQIAQGSTITVSINDANNTTLQYQYNYPDARNPVYIATQTSVQIVATGDFAQFGNGLDTGSRSWPGNAFLTSVPSWNQISNFTGAFYQCTSLTSVPNYLPVVTNSMNMNRMFYNNAAFTGLGIELWNTIPVTNMESAFQSCTNLSPNLNLQNWNTRNVQLMSELFASCVQYRGVGLDIWRTQSCTAMNGMFAGCTNLLSTLDLTPNKNNIPAIWDTSKVTNMRNMFNSCYTFQGIGINLWNTRSLQNTEYMLTNTAFNSNLGSWNIGSIQTMAHMLDYCSMSADNYSQTLIGWNTPDPINWYSVQIAYQSGNTTPFFTGYFSVNPNTNLVLSFYNAANLSTNILNLDGSYGADYIFQNNNFQNGTNITSIPALDASYSAVEWQLSYFPPNTTYVQSLAYKTADQVWHDITPYGTVISFTFASIAPPPVPVPPVLPIGVVLGAALIQYLPSAATARDNLINTYGWTIEGDLLQSAQSIVLRFNDQCVGQPIQLPIKQIGTSVTLQFSDGQPAQTYSGNYPSNPTYTPTEPYAVVVVSGDFLQFGNGDVDFINTWTGSSTLISVNNWSGIQSFTAAFLDCGALATVPNQLPATATDLTFMFFMPTFTNPVFTGVGIDTWTTSQVTNISNMFGGCVELSPSLDLQLWDTGNVTAMSGLFNSCAMFQGLGLNQWKTQSCTRMNAMFIGCSNLLATLDLTPNKGGNPNIWNTSQVDNMVNMFNGCITFQGTGLPLWNTQSVTTMTRMLFGCSAFNRSLGDWNISSIVSMNFMLDNCGMSAYTYSQTLIGWNTIRPGQTIPSNVTLGALNMEYIQIAVQARDNLDIFYNWTINGDIRVYSKIVIQLNNPQQDTISIQVPVKQIQAGFQVTISDGTNTQTLDDTMNYPLNAAFDTTSNAITVQGNFLQFGNADVDHNNGWTGNNYVTSISEWYGIVSLTGAFMNCESLISVPNLLPPILPQSVDLSYMFAMPQANPLFTGLNQLETWDTSNAIDMQRMFLHCTTLYPMLDLSGWNVSSVTNMAFMFNECFRYQGLHLSNWTTTAVVQMQHMFQGCSALQSTLNLSTWNTSSVQNMQGLFKNCFSFQGVGLNLWNTGNTTSMVEMWMNTSFQGNLGTWDLKNVQHMNNMLDNTAMTATQFSDTIVGWDTPLSGTTIPYNIVLGTPNVSILPYAQAAYLDLSNNYNWTFVRSVALIRLHFDQVLGQPIQIPVSNVFDTVTMTTSDYQTIVFNTAYPSNPIYIPTQSSVDVTITGGFSQFGNTNTANGTQPWAGAQKLTRVDEWANIKSFNGAFIGANQLQQIPSDLPPGVYDTSYMFYNNTGITGQGLVESFSMDGVQLVNNMFSGCSQLNCNLFHWNTSHIADAASLFLNCAQFQGDGIDRWDTFSMTNMSNMFYGCSQFNQYLYPGQNIYKWNTGSVNTMASLFSNCYTFQGNGVHLWDTQRVINTSYMFYNCVQLQIHVAPGANNIWNTGNLVYANNMFESCIQFDGNGLQMWDTRSLTNMNYMFYNCSNLIPDLDLSPGNNNTNKGSNPYIWNTSNVTTMISTFSFCIPFQGNGIQLWNTSKVTNMNGMLSGCNLSAELDLSNWDTSQVTDMVALFVNNTLWKGNGIALWNTANVTNMSYMFTGCASMDADLTPNKGQNANIWNTAKVTNMDSLFKDCFVFTGTGIGNWNTSKCTNMNNMFSACYELSVALVPNGDIWDTSKVTNMKQMFFRCFSLQGNGVPLFNTSAVQNMEQMLQDATAFNQNLSLWNIQSVVNMAEMLDNTALSPTNYSSTLIGFNTSANQRNVTLGAQGLQYLYYAINARTNLIQGRGWTIQNDSFVPPSSITLRFTNVTAGTKIQLPIHDISYKVTYTYSDGFPTSASSAEYPNNPFYTCITSIPSLTIQVVGGFSHFGIQVVNQAFTFWPGCDKLKEVISWTSVPNLSGAFINCINLSTVPQSLPDNTTDTSFMFWMVSGIPVFTGLNMVELWDTSQITNMSDMFSGCVNLYPTLDLTPGINNPSKGNNSAIWNTGNVHDMGAIFAQCALFQCKGVNLWNTHSVQNTSAMFYGSNVQTDIALTPGPNGIWDTGQVQHMDYMFFNSAIVGTGINLWNTQSVKTASYMFTNSLFNQNLANWNIGSMTDMQNMLDNTPMSPQNYSNTLIGWNSQIIKPYNITLGAQGLQYLSNAIPAHASLLSNYGWTIVGDYNISPTIVLTFEAPLNTTIQLPLLQISTLIIVSFDDGLTPDQTYLTEYPDNPVYVTKKTTVRIKVIGGFGQFGTGTMTSWPGNMYLTSVNQWSDIASLAGAFVNCISLHTLPSTLPFHVSDMSYMLAMNITGVPSFTGISSMESWDTTTVRYMKGCFYGLTSLSSVDLSQWNTGNVSDMSYLFYNCRAFQGNGIGMWYTNGVQNMSYMLHGCNSLKATLDLTPGRNNPSKGSDVNIWNTSNVTNMQNMLCMYPYTTVPPPRPDPLTNEYIEYPDVPFQGKGVSLFNTPSVKNMANTFQLCNHFDQDLSGWNLTSLNTAQYMLDLTALSATRYLNTLTGWVGQTRQVILGAAGLPIASTPASVSWSNTVAHNQLIRKNKWTIAESNHLYYWREQTLDLSFNCSYQVSVAAITQMSGIGAYTAKSSVFTFSSTIPFVPLPPYVASSNPGSNEILLKWTAPDPRGSTILYYNIQVNPEPGVPYVIKTPSMGTSIPLSLAFRVSYTFQVAAVSNLGTTAYSGISSPPFQLVPGKCDPPTQLRATVIINKVA